MPNNSKQFIWRYDLPSNWEPEGFWCVQITIPGDQQYMDALAGALGLLTKSKSWARDDTQSGARTVAATWERALYKSPFVVNQECIVVDTPAIPNQAAADDAAAAVFQVFFQHVASSINSCATTLDACGTCVDSLYAELTPYGASEAVRGALSQLCAAMNGPESASRTTYETDCPFQAQFDDLRVKINDNPYDWLNQASDWIFAWLNHTTSQIYSALNTVAGLMGGQGIQAFVNDNGGIVPGNGAGFGGSCLFTHVLDLTASDCGFVPHVYCNSPLLLGAQYDGGVGWRTVLTTEGCPPGYMSRPVTAAKTFAARSITSIDVVYSFTRGDHIGYPSTDILFNLEGLPFNRVDPEVGTYHWEGQQTMDRIGINARAGINSNYPVDPGGECIVQQITVSGIGSDPFL